MVLYCLRHYYCLVFCVCSRSVVLKDLRYFYFREIILILQVFLRV